MLRFAPRQRSIASKAAGSDWKNTTPLRSSPRGVKKFQFGLGHHAERAFAADKQVDKIHPRREAESGGMLRGARKTNRGNFEIDRLATPDFENHA